MKTDPYSDLNDGSRPRTIRSIYILVSFLILVLLFSKIPFSDIIRTVSHANGTFLVLALLVSLFNTGCVATERWRRILHAMGCAISFRETLCIRGSVLSLEFFLPFRLGEIVKAAYLKRCHGFAIELALSSVLFEKTLSLWACLAVFILGMGFVILKFPVIIFVLAFGLICLCIFEKRVWLGLQHFTYRVCPSIQGIVSKLVRAFESISFQDKVILCGYSLIIQVLEVLLIYLLALAVNVHLPLLVLPALGALVVLASSIPITFMGAGARELSILVVFALYAPKEALLSLGLLTTMVGAVLPRLLGGIFWGEFINVKS